eukprot:COSAG04_NODE_982_length_9008_cov_3.598720_5_plen_93_part_00
MGGQVSSSEQRPLNLLADFFLTLSLSSAPRGVAMARIDGWRGGDAGRRDDGSVVAAVEQRSHSMARSGREYAAPSPEVAHGMPRGMWTAPLS